MIKFGKGVVKLRIPILILSILLLIPAGLGYLNTRVNYDILTYLPEDIETMKGQDILLKEFGTGAFSFCVVEGMEAKEIAAMREEIAEVPHVKDVIWFPMSCMSFSTIRRRAVRCLRCSTIPRCQRMRRWMRSKKSVPL